MASSQGKIKEAPEDAVIGSRWAFPSRPRFGRKRRIAVPIKWMCGVCSGERCCWGRVRPRRFRAGQMPQDKDLTSFLRHCLLLLEDALFVFILSDSQWPRGVTVSTLDSESSDRGSNPREAFSMLRRPGKWHQAKGR